jgi:hypothetical protein
LLCKIFKIFYFFHSHRESFLDLQRFIIVLRNVFQNSPVESISVWGRQPSAHIPCSKIGRNMQMSKIIIDEEK